MSTELEDYSRELAKDLEDVVEPGMAAFIAAYRETVQENGDWLDFLVAAEERGVGLIRFLKLDLTNKLAKEHAEKHDVQPTGPRHFCTERGYMVPDDEA